MAPFVIPNGYGVDFHKVFKKQYKQLPTHIARRADQRLELLCTDPNNQKLRVHELKGKLAPMLSFDVNHDYRVWFLIDDNDEVVRFFKVGTHSELYS